MTNGCSRWLTAGCRRCRRALSTTYCRCCGGRSPSSSPGCGGGWAPQVVRWLGDIRTYCPASVVQVMQRDAIDRLGLSALLLEPEMLEAVEAGVHLVGTLLSLHKAMPETTKQTARAVVRKVVDDLDRRLAAPPPAPLPRAPARPPKGAPPPHPALNAAPPLLAPSPPPLPPPHPP